MGGFDFERPSFVQAGTNEPPHRQPSSVAKPLIVLLLAAVAAFAVYRLLKVSEVPDVAQNSPEVPEMEQRVEELEHRLDQIEKRRRVWGAEAAPAAGKQASQKPKSAPAVAAAPASDLISPPPEPQPVSPPTPQSSQDSSTAKQKDIISAGPEVSSTQEGWEATADRLGNVVGELASQRNEIKRTRESLDQLSGRFGRESESFTLRKGSGRQRVGPVWLGLQNTDPRNQRYTLRLFLDDKSIELRDRALHEAVQFHPSDSKVSLELVVSEIRKDGVTGRVAIPKQP